MSDGVQLGEAPEESVESALNVNLESIVDGRVDLAEGSDLKDGMAMAH